MHPLIKHFMLSCFGEYKMAEIDKRSRLSADFEAPGLSEDIEAPGLSEDIEAPGLSEDIENPRPI